ncbi:hypothetical protein AURDEDRAFT_120797 [Auricularia subglabra TFB-10046 SS5]|nr:hypothetical protein AURDEDRAFT_120797 [Auricularia subglabra TFB-10046 SS5]
MSISTRLQCGIQGHDSSQLYSVWDIDIYADEQHTTLRPELKTVNDLVAFVDKAHLSLRHHTRTSSVASKPPYWTRAECRIGVLLDGTAALNTADLGELEGRTIHLIVGTKVPPVQLGRGLTSGLRRLGGDLCRVAGSHEARPTARSNIRAAYTSFQRILPETSSFPEILRTAGCYYVERFDWIMDTLGGEADVNTRIPIIRRPPGFGKSTFLSAYASYCDGVLDLRLFPGLRDAEYRIIPRTLLVFHLDFSQLQLVETMSDEEMHAECLRFMYAAAETFYAKYAPLLGQDAPPFDVDNTPTGNVKASISSASKELLSNSSDRPVCQVLARKLDRQIFLSIDNYTAPFLHLEPTYEREPDTPFFRIELAMRKFVIAYLLLAAGSGLIARGLITGTSLPGAGAVLPFQDSGLFSTYTQDLTHKPTAAHVIGFTRADVEELVRSYLGVTDDRVLEIAARVVPRQYDPNTEVDVTYAPREVLATLRAIAADADPHHPESESITSSSGEEARAIAQLLRTPVDSSDTATFSPK